MSGTNRSIRIKANHRSLKRGIDADKLMAKLYRMTPLEDSYSCNFNILIGGSPQVMGVYQIIEEWAAFRYECVRRRTLFDLQKKKDKLHLLKGNSRTILLDIDKAIRIIRETDEEARSGSQPDDRIRY